MRVLFKTLGLYAAFFAAACHQGPPVRNTAGADELMPGFVLTTRNGYGMHALIDGQRWTASQMRPYDYAGWAIRIEGIASGKSIGFYLWLPGLRTNDSVGFFAGSPADLVLKPGGDIWKGTSGEVHIQRIDPQLVEGSFRFAAVCGQSDSVIRVTEGYFRVPLVVPAP